MHPRQDTATNRTRRQLLAGLGMGAAATMLRSGNTLAAGSTTGISHSMETIHQVVRFNATPARVYAALTDASQFHKVTLLSAAAQSGMAQLKTPTQISREPGGAFALFGGLITGRQIELVADLRIVQAWRAGDWDAGVYSIARFELQAKGAATQLVFDHTGFPAGAAEHLAEGWKTNYWEPLEKFLA